LQRNTVQRQIILETLKKYDTHPTVDELYNDIHENHPSISRTTIYRNLRQLAQGGQISKVVLPDNSDRYDKRTDQHYHFLCKTCGTLFDVDIDRAESIDAKVQEKYEVQVEEHEIVFMGLCKECSSRELV